MAPQFPNCSRSWSRMVPIVQMATISMLLWNGGGDTARGQSAENLRLGGRLDLVVSTSLFRAVNRNDAVPALRTWANLVAEKRGIQFEPAIQIFNDAAGIRKHVLTGASGVMVLDAHEYLQLSDLKTVEPMFSADRGSGNISSRYLLIARNEPGGGSLPSLRNRRLFVHASTAANLGMVWLQSLLAGSRPEAYFGSVEVTEKPSAAILPVFFGRADAAVIDEASFEVSKEMNPQLGRKLRVVSASPELTEAVVCLFGSHIVLRNELIASIRDLHLDVQGKQILTTLRFSRMAPLNAAALERSIELVRKQNGLTMYPKAAAAAGKVARRVQPYREAEAGEVDKEMAACFERNLGPHFRYLLASHAANPCLICGPEPSAAKARFARRVAVESTGRFFIAPGGNGRGGHVGGLQHRSGSLYAGTER